MADKWLSRLFGRTPTQTVSSTQLNESPHVGPSPGTSPPTNNDHRQLLKDITPINGSPVSSPPQTRNLRSFDPSALNNGHSDSQSLFVNTTDASTRKRQLLNSPDGLLASERIKRFRDNIAAARDDETDRLSHFESSMVRPRMEHSFAGPYTQRNTSMLDSPGGSSTISIFSRRSTAPSTHSNVSSKTRAILEQLERVATPLTESKRVPMFRPASTVPEVWNTSWHAGTRSTISTANASPNPPPLRRQPIQIPNRMQMLNSAMTTHYKKPYWRDIYRPKKPVIDDKPSALFQSPTIQRVQASSVVKVSPLFDLSDYPSPAASTVKETGSSIGQQGRVTAPVKGHDGKKVPNTFNAEYIFMEDSDGEQEKDSLVTVAKKIDLPMVAPPQKGFISNWLFDFEAPVERGPQLHVASEESSSESDSSDSSEDELVEVQAKSTEVETAEVRTKSDQKAPTFEPRSGSATVPPTDSESSASVVATPVSSQNTSPENLNKTPVETAVAPKWYCSGCMVENAATFVKCPCCDTPREGQAGSTPAPTFKPTIFVPGSTSMRFGINKTTNGISPATSLGLPQTIVPTPGILSEPPTSNHLLGNNVPDTVPKKFQFGPSTAPLNAPLVFGLNSATASTVNAVPSGVSAPASSTIAAPAQTFVGSAPAPPTIATPAQTFGGGAPVLTTIAAPARIFGGGAPAPSTIAPPPQTNGFSFGINGIGASLSAPSLGLPQPIAPTPSSLGISTIPPTSFNFNNVPDTAPKRFQFGPTVAPSNAPYVFGANPAATQMTNAISFGGGGAPASSTIAALAPTFGVGAPTPFTIPNLGNAPPADSPFAFSNNAAVGLAGRKVASARRRLTHKR